MATTVRSADCLSAIDRGTAFIKQQLHDGRYGLACCGSDGTARFSDAKGHLFSAFFIARALGSEITEVERSVLLVRIMTEEMNGHWGYSPRGYYKGDDDNPFFVDADDTAFALRTYRQLGVYQSPEPLLAFLRNKPWFRRNAVHSRTGFVTFAAKKHPTLAVERRNENNLEMHPEVNANVFNLFVDTDYDNLINWSLVSQAQSSEGFWYSFFYPSKFYGTMMFLELLKQFDVLAEETQRGLRFLEQSQNGDGSWGEVGNAYETALALNSLAFHESIDDRFLQGLTFIANRQNADGSWDHDGTIWEFHDVGNDVWRARDANRVVTTSLCVSALRYGSVKDPA